MKLDCSPTIFSLSLDVDECLEDNGGCDQVCTNKPGTHMCECNDGYTKTSESGYCVDINECALNNGHGPCQDTCINLEGSYACSCEGMTNMTYMIDIYNRHI